MNIAHLPTLLLAIGYPFFWAEMASGRAREGVTSPLAWGLFVFFVVLILWRERHTIAGLCGQCRQAFEGQDRFTRIFLLIVCLAGIFILGCVFWASLLPPHLIQESDVMNYHYSMPRQHLILGFFEHIPWSADDLFFLPIDFALAPFWFATVLPNKIPQFIFLIGLLGVAVSLTSELKKENAWIACALVATALLGSHGHGVQMGTAMLDLVVCYLCLALLDSFLKRQKWLFIIEFTFFVWAKSLAPLQVAAIALVMAALWLIMKKMGFRTVSLDFQRAVTTEEGKANKYFLKQAFWGVLFLSLFVAGPFLFKSLYYTGTPVFPVAVGTFSFHPGIEENSVAWRSIKASAENLAGSIHRDEYGRSVIDFFSHFWMLAVPDKGVNNAFDYPMGLVYLLCLGPFLAWTFGSLRRKEFALFPLLIVVYWFLWWMTARETRYLYGPVLLMFIVVAVQMKKPSKVFLIALVMALFFNATSIFRAHQPYFGLSREEALRPEDKKLVGMSREYLREKRSDTVELKQFEVAFAQFPVVVRKEILPHVVAF